VRQVLEQQVQELVLAQEELPALEQEQQLLVPQLEQEQQLYQQLLQP
jgi:uncharacterized protein involved in exopolysaccharide biosynthesis